MREEFSTCSKSSKQMEFTCTSNTMWLHHWCFLHNMQKQSNAIFGIILKALWARVWFSIIRHNLSGSLLADISFGSEINIFIENKTNTTKRLLYWKTVATTRATHQFVVILSLQHYLSIIYNLGNWLVVIIIVMVKKKGGKKGKKSGGKKSGKKSKDAGATEEKVNEVSKEMFVIKIKDLEDKIMRYEEKCKELQVIL